MLNMLSLLTLANFDRVMNAQTVAATVVNGSVIDMAGFEGVIFVALFGTITDGTPTLKAQQGQASNLSDAADLTGTAVVELATDDNKIALLDIFRPDERYLRPVVDRSTGSASTGSVIDGVIAIRYGARNIPTTQGSTVANSEAWVTPAEGTA